MRSAEFRRNLWLELSPQRVIALPLIVLVVVLMQQATGGGNAQLAQVGSWLYFGMVLLWGSRRAAAAVTEEVNSGTWAGQRLSALSPAALALGKLFGATAFIWYGGAIGLGLFVGGALGDGVPPLWAAAEAVQRIAWGVFVHAVAVAASLVLLNKRRLVERVGTTLPHMLALAAAVGLYMLFWRSPLFIDVFVDHYGWQLRWYELKLPTWVFLPAVSAIFAGWAVLACLRLMAVQLQRQPLPWAWPAFSLFLLAFAHGFVPGDVGKDFGLIAPQLIAVALFYLALFADRNEPLRFRHGFAALRDGALRRGLSLMPWWDFSWLILLAVALWPSAMDAVRGLWEALARHSGATIADPLIARLGVAAFALRDAAFVLFVNAGGRSQRSDLVAFIYLLVLYGPVLGLLLGMEAWPVAAMFAPLPFGPAGLGLASALVQAAVLALLTRQRWRALFLS